MKTIRLCIYLCFLCCFNSLSAQEEESGNGLLFPQFEKGIVIFKNGTRSAATLNYNMLQEEMVFQDDDGSILTVANPSEIRVVTIGERRFLPSSSRYIFYEEIQAGTGSFFIQRKATRLSQGKATGYGGYSQTASIDTYNSFSASGQTIKINPGFVYHIKDLYFDIAQDAMLMKNHEGGACRPTYLCLQDERTGLYWAIPMSSRTEKHNAVIDKNVNRLVVQCFKECRRLHNKGIKVVFTDIDRLEKLMLLPQPTPLL